VRSRSAGSLDGAKCNVSEILGKHGLASREEAAEYWRWRHQGSRSRVRALLGAPLARVAVGVGLTVVATGTMIAIAAAFGGDSHEQSQPLVAQWVLEGEFYQRREVANWMLEPPENADRGTARWVYVDETHWRIERRYRTERDGASSGLVVADGQFVHIYEGGPNWHYKVPIKWLPAGFLKDFASGGPEFRRIEGSIDESVRTKQRTGGQPEWHQPDAWRAGSDTLLGFTVEVVESTPSWSNSQFRTSGASRASGSSRCICSF
jgi:hypothetical protein